MYNAHDVLCTAVQGAKMSEDATGEHAAPCGGASDPPCLDANTQWAQRPTVHARTSTRTPHELHVQWHGVPPGLANALRRGMLQHVPVWALQATCAKVKCNNSVTTDEQVMHCLQFTPLRQGAPPPLHAGGAAAWKRCAVPAAIGVAGSSTRQRIAAGFPMNSQVHVTRVTSGQLMVAPAPSAPSCAGAWQWDATHGVVETPPLQPAAAEGGVCTAQESQGGADSEGDSVLELPPDTRRAHPQPCTLTPHRGDALITRLRHGERVGVRTWGAWGTPWAHGSHHTSACAVLHAVGGGGGRRWEHSFTVDAVGQVPPAYIVAAGAGAVAAQCTALSRALRRNCPPVAQGAGVGVWRAATAARTALRRFVCLDAAEGALASVWKRWADAADAWAPPPVPQHSAPRTVSGPQACLRCGRALGHVYTAVASAPQLGGTVEEALDAMGLPSDVPHLLCCRVQAMATVDPSEAHFALQRTPALRGDVLMNPNWADTDAPSEHTKPVIVHDAHRGTAVCTNPSSVLHVRHVLDAAEKCAVASRGE